MTTFKLDTSGYVQCQAPDQKPNESTGCWFWSDLSPFVQGYIEAAAWSTRRGDSNTFAFRDLAPETLARFIEDCERRIGHLPTYRQADDRQNVDYGRLFWVRRQAGDLIKFGFPPLTLYLRDDGKVHHLESA